MEVILHRYRNTSIQLISKMTTLEKYDFSSLKYLTASFLATYCSGFVHPLDVIKTRLQSHDGKSTTQNLVPKYDNIKNAVKYIYKDQGFRGLYKGFHVSLLCQASSMALFFWIYQTRKKHFQKRGHHYMDTVTIASIEASILATLITQPIWVVKTRMLLNINPHLTQYQSCLKQIKQIHQQHGYKGFLKGLQLSLILSFTGVIQMYSYEGAKKIYEKMIFSQSRFDQKNFICGGVSKIFAVFVSYPITTVRTRIQQNQFINSNVQKYGSAMEITSRAIREEGVAGLYKGVTANMMRGVSQKGIYFYFYQIFKECMFGRSKASY